MLYEPDGPHADLRPSPTPIAMRFAPPAPRRPLRDRARAPRRARGRAEPSAARRARRRSRRGRGRAAYRAGEVVVRYGGGAHASAAGAVPRTKVVKVRDVAAAERAAAQADGRPERHAATTSRTSPAGCRRTRATPPTPGGWQALQWNFLADTGVNAPDAWVHLAQAGPPGRQGRDRRGAGHRRRLRRPRPLPQVAGPQRRSASSAAGTSSTTTRTRTTTSATAPTSPARSPRAPATRSA